MINITFLSSAALGTPHSRAPTDSTTESFVFKLLCPAAVTGLIIGKGGAVMNQMNSTTGAKIKLSQNNEYFPTTSDRILVSKSYF